MHPARSSAIARPGAFAIAIAIAFALGSLLALTACGTTAPREPGFVSLERTTNAAGAAAGPVYIVTLFTDGRVIFEGNAAVKSKGTFSKTIPMDAADAVFARIDAINLWDRERRYDVERAEAGGDSIIVRTASTEVPWDILRARNRGRSIRIDGLFFAPHEIMDLKNFVEKTVGLAEWIGEPQERVK